MKSFRYTFLIFLCAILLPLQVTHAIDSAEPAMTAGKYAKVYRGPKGESVTVVDIEGEDGCLMLFERVEGDWDGKIIRHKIVKMGDKSDFRADIPGRERAWTTLATRQSWWMGESYTIQPLGSGPFNAMLDVEASKEVIPQHLVTAYLQQEEETAQPAQ
jgi:hypothetical protein